MTKKKIIIMGVFISVFTVLLDQISKTLIINTDFEIVPNLLRICYNENTGNIIGLGEVNAIFILIVDLCIFGIIIKLIIGRRNEMNTLTLLSLFLILSGIISNLIDRLWHGYVIDFIQINFCNFPIFNVADTLVVLGIAILFIFNLRIFSKSN